MTSENDDSRARVDANYEIATVDDSEIPPVAMRPERHFTSEGQRLLCSLTSSRSALAKALGASDSMVGFIKAGTKHPGEAIQRRAEKHFGIPRVAWGQAARTGDAPVADSEPVADANQNPTDIEEPDPNESSLEKVERSLRGVVRIQNAFLEGGPGSPSNSEYLKATDTGTRLIALRSKLMGDSRTDEEKLAQSGRWLAIRSLLARVLVRHPEAARDVSDALKAEGLA